MPSFDKRRTLLNDQFMKSDLGPMPDACSCSATAMRKASRRMTQLYDEALAPSGLRSTQFAILAELNRRKQQPPTVAELAEILVMDRSALGHNLRPLERDGFIAIRTCESDRRRRLITTLVKGQVKFLKARVLWQTAQDHFNTVYGGTEAGELRRQLLHIAHDTRLAEVS